MSSVLEFWPFNYERYTELILPALMEAMQGNTGPLLELVAEGESERLNMFNPWTGGWTMIPIPPYVPVPWENIKSCIARASRMRFGEWSGYGLLLHAWLIRGFCMQGLKDVEYIGLREDESIWTWRWYMEDQDEGKRLWRLFETEPDEEIRHKIPYLPLDKDDLRALDPFVSRGLRGTPMGFITPDETRELCRYVRRHSYRKYKIPADLSQIGDNFKQWAVITLTQEYPIPGFYEGEHEKHGLQLLPPERFVFNPYFLDAQGNRLIGLTHITNDWHFLHVLPVEVYEGIEKEYDNEGPLFQRYVQEHRHSVETMRREYMESVWRKECIILKRLEFAAERGLGMLRCYVSGG